MTWRVVGVDFGHEHMNGLLEYVRDHLDAEVVGLCDDERERSMADIESTATTCDLSSDRVYSDPATCVEETDPDVAILCPATGGPREASRTDRSVQRPRYPRKAIRRVVG